MKKPVPKVFFFLMLILSTYISCTKEVDFDQVDDLVLTPVVESSIFHFEASAEDFILGGMENLRFNSGFVEIDVFNNRFVNEDLVKAELVFEVVNSINRGYEITIEFWDDSFRRYSLPVSASSSPINESLIFNTTEEFEGVKLLNLKATTRLRFRLTMLSGVPIDSNTPGKISLKSKGVFYLNIEA